MTAPEDEATALARAERAFRIALAGIRAENRFAPARTPAQQRCDAVVAAWAMRIAGERP